MQCKGPTFMYKLLHSCNNHVHIRQNSPQIAPCTEPPGNCSHTCHAAHAHRLGLQWTTQMSNSSEPLLGPGHAGYQCLGCKRTWSTLFALGQHNGSPYLRGTKCGIQSSIVELRNVPRADLATGLIQAVPLYRTGTRDKATNRRGINIFFKIRYNTH